MKILPGDGYGNVIIANKRYWSPALEPSCKNFIYTKLFRVYYWRPYPGYVRFGGDQWRESHRRCFRVYTPWFTFHIGTGKFVYPDSVYGKYTK